MFEPFLSSDVPIRQMGGAKHKSEAEELRLIWMVAQIWGTARTAAQRGCPMIQKLLLRALLYLSSWAPLPRPRCMTSAPFRAGVL